MISHRTRIVFLSELGYHLRRPMFWVLIFTLALTSFGLSSGQVKIQSGDALVGGTKAWITSEMSQSMGLALIIFIFYIFFIAIIAGTSILRDDELNVGPLLHSTPLKPSEYVLGKFLSVIAFFCIVLALHVLFVIVSNHWIPNTEAAEIRGPFHLLNYAKPAVIFGIPNIFLLTGLTFFLGVYTRKTASVFFMPVIFFLFCAFFLWNWSPSWLDPDINKLLMLIDPSGFRWLNETYLKVDRGVQFYNTQPLTFDTVFLSNRIATVLAGIAGVLLSIRRFAGMLRSTPVKKNRWKLFKKSSTTASLLDIKSSLCDLSMPATPHIKPPGIWRSLRAVFHNEFTELRSQAGMYLFIPLILLQTIGSSLMAVGAFETPLLLTPGTFAVRTMNQMTLMICLLLLFYTVESLLREKNTQIAPLIYASPIPTAPFIAGKCLANTAIGIIIPVSVLIAGWITILIQGKVAFSLTPFAIIWGLLLVPTFLFWVCCVAMIYSITKNRYGTYAICLAAMILTGYLQLTDRMTWVGNWDLWNAVIWSDMGIFQLDRKVLILNRLLVLSLAFIFGWIATAFFRRTESDLLRTLQWWSQTKPLRSVLKFIPVASIPLILIFMIWFEVRSGIQGSVTEKAWKDYWRRNTATWQNVELPSLKHVRADLDLYPEERSFKIAGTYRFVNEHPTDIRAVPLTGAPHWKNVKWTVGNRDFEPENHSMLYVFKLSEPLNSGEEIEIGFNFSGSYPQGSTKNGGGLQEFILPAGVVLTSFTPSFLPMPGYQEELGIDEENRYDAKEYPDDFYAGETDPLFGNKSPFTLEMNISAPAEFGVNGVGILNGHEVSGDRGIWHWKTDHPVRFFNVVAGKWSLQEGSHSKLFYHPGHPYNTALLTDAMDAAMVYYSQWFKPYPWMELKISEFPGLSSYAQGFPTNITFSESIGFLTQDEPGGNAAFVVAAHEISHQWWGNILTPGKGPSGNLCAEGLAHFSTMLLLDQVKGAPARMEFCRRVEHDYLQDRQADSEKSLLKTDGSMPGDRVVMYDKTSFVFWMMSRIIGRENLLDGLQEVIAKYEMGPDYPVMQDLIDTIRPYAPDKESFDTFTDQWVSSVVLPHYVIEYAEVQSISNRQESSRWETSFSIKNIGTGTIPVEISICSGEAFDKELKPNPEFREIRCTAAFDSGSTESLVVETSFKPEKIVVDPDVDILQTARTGAVAVPVEKQN